MPVIVNESDVVDDVGVCAKMRQVKRMWEAKDKMDGEEIEKI